MPHCFTNSGTEVLQIYWAYAGLNVTRTNCVTGETSDHLADQQISMDPTRAPTRRYEPPYRLRRHHLADPGGMGCQFDRRRSSFAHVIDDARWCFVDMVGICLAGSRDGAAGSIARVATGLGGKRQATVIAFGAVATNTTGSLGERGDRPWA